MVTVLVSGPRIWHFMIEWRFSCLRVIEGWPRYALRDAVSGLGSLILQLLVLVSAYKAGELHCLYVGGWTSSWRCDYSPANSVEKPRAEFGVSPLCYCLAIQHFCVSVQVSYVLGDRPASRTQMSHFRSLSMGEICSPAAWTPAWNHPHLPVAEAQ